MKIKMTLQFDDGDCEMDVELPGHYEVCPECEGEGKHLMPSMRDLVFSQEDMDDDPDFFDEYFSGHYDVRCTVCNGERVIAVVDEERIPDEIRPIWEEHQQLQEMRAHWDAEDRAVMRAERGYLD